MSDLIAVAVVDLKAGPALDWAVAKAVGKSVSHLPIGGGNVGIFEHSDSEWQSQYSPSTNWAQGGSLLEPIEMACWHSAGSTHRFEFSSGDIKGSAVGSTMLEAACKAIVAAKFGDAVTIPRELVEVSK